MKIGVAVSTYPLDFGPVVFAQGTLRERLAAAREIGYDGVDLFAHFLEQNELEEVKGLLDEYGLEVSMFIPFRFAEMGFSLSDTDEERRKEFVGLYQKQIDCAAFLKARTMPIGFIRGNMQEGDTPGDYQARLAKSLVPLCDYAMARGIRLCIEPLNRYECGTFHTVAETVAFLRAFGLGEMRILLDSYHMNIEEASMEGAIACAGIFAGHFHTSDNNRLAPGMGHIAFAPLVRALAGIEYDGYLSVEALPQPDSMTSARIGLACLRACVEGVPA